MYFPSAILNTKNFAPATSPFAVNDIGPPRIVEASFTFATAWRSSVRVILPSLHASVAAVA